jgi:hypothetical protein
MCKQLPAPMLLLLLSEAYWLDFAVLLLLLPMLIMLLQMIGNNSCNDCVYSCIAVQEVEHCKQDKPAHPKLMTAAQS